ncbi:MAG: hypothetical protein ABFS86_20375, partial [Planctomycetota bacterium]
HQLLWRSSRCIQRELGIKGHLWETSYFATQIQDVVHLLVAMTYDHLSPVVENMVARPEEHTRSSAGWWAGEACSEVSLLLHPLPFGLDEDAFRESLLALQSSKLGRGITGSLTKGELDLASPAKRESIRKQLEAGGFWPE